MASNIIRNQKIAPGKLARAKELRQQMTPGEALLWDRLRRSQLSGFHFRRQQLIDGYITDFYCASRGLAVEVDGKIHAGQAAYDAEREANLNARGVRVFRITEEAVRQDIEGVLAKILNALKS